MAGAFETTSSRVFVLPLNGIPSLGQEEGFPHRQALQAKTWWMSSPSRLEESIIAPFDDRARAFDPHLLIAFHVLLGGRDESRFEVVFHVVLPADPIALQGAVCRFQSIGQSVHFFLQLSLKGHEPAKMIQVPLARPSYQETGWSAGALGHAGNRATVRQSIGVTSPSPGCGASLHASLLPKTENTHRKNK